MQFPSTEWWSSGNSPTVKMVFLDKRQVINLISVVEVGFLRGKNVHFPHALLFLLAEIRSYRTQWRLRKYQFEFCSSKRNSLFFSDSLHPSGNKTVGYWGQEQPFSESDVTFLGILTNTSLNCAKTEILPQATQGQQKEYWLDWEKFIH